MHLSKNTLTTDQHNVVTYDDGPLLVVAGAGTGKTFTLVEKITYLLNSKKIKPEQILCLTFTEKASNEMMERIDIALPYGMFGVSIQTFHAFADTVLKQEAIHIGLNPVYQLMTQAESVLFLKKNIQKFNLKYFRPASNPNKFVTALLQHFSRLQDEDITPEQYVCWATHLKVDKIQGAEEIAIYTELAQAYHTYETLKKEHGKADFSNLISNLLFLFRERPHILKQYRERYTHILVDEFQDTNIAQYQLIKLLCPAQSSPHLTVVGDDSQAIYKFRGASISNILSFMQDYPKAKMLSLIDNYRSNQQVLDHAYQLIQHNNPDTLESKLGISKQLISHSHPVADAVDFTYFTHGSQEATWTVETILKLKKKYKYAFRDFCILVRANAHSELFTAEMRTQGVPYQFHGPGSLFRQREIKDIIAYMRVLTDIDDSVAFYRLLMADFLEFNPPDVASLLSFAKKTGQPLVRACRIVCSFFYPDWWLKEYEVYRASLPLLHEATRTELIKLLTHIDRHLAILTKESAAHIVYKLLEETGYFKKLLSRTSEKDQEIVQNIALFLHRLRSLEVDRDLSSMFDAITYIDLSIDMGESPHTQEFDTAQRNAVHIMTVHGAKGLEFPVVFLPHLIQGRFPSQKRAEPIPIPEELIKEALPSGDYHLQEERRLFYVALTRAKDRIFLTASSKYEEGVRKRIISPFVTETVGELLVRERAEKKQEDQLQLSIFDFTPKQPVIEPKQKTALIKNLSYSQLQAYEVCPLQYKYQYILKIPMPQAAAASFGSTIHIVLQKFYQQFLSGNKGDKNTLLELLEQSWIPLGYDTPAHEKQDKERARVMLGGYYDTFHHPDIPVSSLERLFKIKIGQELCVTGKIDRVDTLSDGSIEIIDYKTGKAPDEKVLKKSLQLSIYALAAGEKNIYDTPVNKVKLTLYYLQDMKKYTSSRTDGDIIAVKQHINTMADKINEQQFAPRVGPWCTHCPFKIICPAW